VARTVFPLSSYQAIYFVIGPERQLDLYEAYLKSVEGADGRLYRLYPRDFWMVRGVN
jgi:hypothetical protein